MRFAAGLLIVASIAFADAVTPPFAVGALRRDGVIIPFAVFNGKRWSVRWPAPSIELDVPINLRAVPSSWWGPVCSSRTSVPWLVRSTIRKTGAATVVSPSFTWA